MSALDTSPDTQSAKVGKTEKTQPAVSRRKSPNQRRYKGVRSREYLLPSEIDAMMKAIKKHGGRHAHRDATLVLLLYRHGLRVGEVVDGFLNASLAFSCLILCWFFSDPYAFIFSSVTHWEFNLNSSNFNTSESGLRVSKR
ncbi:hypothetical protein [Nostoc sp.]|uniref:hypothetical protein n=1 Tax=Nostoc sp. TaxID=1180 RepID=UPI002FF89318